MSGHRKKKHGHEEEHENHERWLVSYADFITLLFAFFVVMYSVSKVDNKKLSQAAESVRWAMHMGGSGGVTQMPLFDSAPASGGGRVVDGAGGGAGSGPGQQSAVDALRKQLEKRVQPFLLARAGVTTVSILAEGGHLTVRLAAAELFDEGQAALRPQILPVLDAIAEEISPLEKPLRVEGHTDDLAVSSGRFHDNWELSAARAATVVSYLERAHHVAPELLSAVGLAATRPIAPDDTAEARTINRRVEIAVEFEAQRRPEGPSHADPNAARVGPRER